MQLCNKYCINEYKLTYPNNYYWFWANELISPSQEISNVLRVQNHLELRSCFFVVVWLVGWFLFCFAMGEPWGIICICNSHHSQINSYLVRTLNTLEDGGKKEKFFLLWRKEETTFKGVAHGKLTVDSSLKSKQMISTKRSLMVIFLKKNKEHKIMNFREARKVGGRSSRN